MTTNKRDWRGYFDVTGIDPRLIIQVAYSGSRPQGLGYLHSKPGGLTEADLNEIMERSEKWGRGSIDIDYLNGRSMKFHIHRDVDTGRMYFNLDWYDHGREATEWLVREIDLPNVEPAINKARAEKAELEAEWVALQERSARLCLQYAAERNGIVCDADVDAIYRAAEQPMYDGWCYGNGMARENGWLSWDSKSRTHTLTDAGRAILNQAEG